MASADLGPDQVTVREAEGLVRVEIQSERTIPYTLSTTSRPPMVTLTLPGFRGAGDQRPMDVNKYPVKGITPVIVGKPVPGLELKIALTELVFPEVRKQGHSLVVEFPKSQKPDDGNLGTPEAADNVGASLPTESRPAESPASQGAVVPASLQKIEIQRRAGDVTVLLLGDGDLPYRIKRVDAQRLVVDLPNVVTSLKQPLTVAHELIKQVRIGRHQRKTRLVLDLLKPVEFSVDPGVKQLAIRLSPAAPASEMRYAKGGAGPETVPVGAATEPPDYPNSEILRAAQAVALRPDSPRLAQMAPDEKAAARELPEELGQRRYVGRRISMDFQQADISNVLRLLAEVSGFNIVVGENVKAKVTMKLVGVPWDQALDMLLKMNNLGMIREGNIVWIDSLANLSRQQDEEARAKESKSKAEDLVTEVVYIRNLQAQEVQTTLRPYLTPRGQLNVSPGSNLLVIRDTPSNLAIFRRLVEGLDLEVPQVQIEARIVQADTTYIRSLGIQWGYANLNSVGTNRVLNFRGQAGGGSTATQDAFGSQTSQFLVNLPATVTGLTNIPAAGITFGKIGGDVLDMRISAGELLNLAKVIAAPKIMTLDKREARIEQGESIPFQTISLQGTQTTFVDANLTLQVTPQITSRDPKEQFKQILLRVRATRNAVGTRSNPAGPSIDKREAATQVLVRDGETMVIGGIFVDNQTNFSQGVPWLSRIPVLGWFFKSKVETINKQELLIFLTPTIVKT
jgi:type IV pilus assembly protein PilQ